MANQAEIRSFLVNLPGEAVADLRRRAAPH